MASPADLPDRRDCVVRELLLRWARELNLQPLCVTRLLSPPQRDDGASVASTMMIEARCS